MAWSAAKAYGKASRAATASVQGALERQSAASLPRKVRSRGYLAPGDAVPPPGTDLLDYSGLASFDRVRSSVLNSPGVTIGAAIDLGDGAAAAPYRLPLERFFQHVSVVAPPGKGKTYGVIAPLAVRLLRDADLQRAKP